MGGEQKLLHGLLFPAAVIGLTAPLREQLPTPLVQQHEEHKH